MFKNDEDFISAWNCVLDEGSFKLMNLLSVRPNKLCSEIKEEIRVIMVELSKYTNHNQYHSLNQKVTTGAQKYELDLINKKRTKLNRDRNDKFSSQYRTHDPSSQKDP